MRIEACTFFLMYCLSLTCISQELLNGEFYSISVEGEFQLNQSSVDDGLVDVVTVFGEGKKPKYLIYLMKNRIDTIIDNKRIIDPDYHFSLSKDLKCKALSVVRKESFGGLTGFVSKVSFYTQERPIVGYLFIHVNGEVLNRVLFMIPNEEYYITYFEEVRKTLSSFKLIQR